MFSKLDLQFKVFVILVEQRFVCLLPKKQNFDSFQENVSSSVSVSVSTLNI